MNSGITGPYVLVGHSVGALVSRLYASKYEDEVAGTPFMLAAIKDAVPDCRFYFAGSSEYVEAMWMMLQQDRPDDFVVATGETHSVEEFASLAFAIAGLNYRDYLQLDQRLYRPSEVHLLVGDPDKARRVLGWRHRTSFEQLVYEMVAADCHSLGCPLDKATVALAG